VSKGTVYLYFASKDDLFRAIIEKKVVVLIEGVESLARRHQGTATELLTAVIERLWEVMARPDIIRLCRLVQAELGQFPEIRRFFFDQVIQRHRRALRAIAARGVASGEFRRQALVVIPRMVPSLVMQLNLNRFLFGDLDSAAPASATMRDAVIALLLDGIARSPRTARAAPRGRKKRGITAKARPALIAALGLAVAAGGLTAQAVPSRPLSMTIGEALARGRSSGIDAALARLGAQQSTVRSDIQHAALLPQVDLSGSALRQTVNLREFGFSIPGAPAVTDPFTLFRARAGASQVLFDAGTVERVRAARDSAIAAGLDAQRAGDVTAALAGAAWLHLAGATETVLARQQDSVTAFALLEIARSQVDAGTAPRIDLTRSETRAAAVRVAIAVARNDRDRATLELARAVDLPPGTPIVIQADSVITAQPMPADIDSAIAMARAHRPDYAAEQQRAAVMQRELAAIRAERLPSITASGYGQTSGTAIDNLYGTWNIGVYLAWPIFDGLRRERRIDEQQLRIDAEKIRLHDLDASIETEVRGAALDIASAREQLSLAGNRVRLAEEELSEAQQRFSAGVAGSVETTDAEAELASARDALIQARLAAGAAQVNAARAMGMLDSVK